MAKDSEELLELAKQAAAAGFPSWWLLAEAQASTRMSHDDEVGTYVVE